MPREAKSSDEYVDCPMFISLCLCEIQELVCRTNAAADEREHEGCISGDLRRNLELEKSIAETEQDNVDGADGASNAGFREELTDSSKNHQGSSCEVDNAKDIREIHGDGVTTRCKLCNREAVKQ